MNLSSYNNDHSFLQHLADLCPAVICIIEKQNFNILYGNNKFQQYLGYPIPDTTDRNISFYDLIEEYQHVRFHNQLASLQPEHQLASEFTIYNIICADKKKVKAFVRVAFFNAPNGEQHYYLLINPDLTAVTIPFLSYDTSALFMEHFKDEHFGTFEWMIGEDKVYWSSGVYRIYEVDESIESFGREFVSVFMHPADKEKTETSFRESMMKGDQVNLEYKIVTAKKNVKVVHALGRRIDNAEGQPIKFIGSIRDITVRREIEEHLRNKIQELNETNRELEEFAYVASHDMQEPLRKITTFSSRLQEKYGDLLTGEGAMYLSRMVNSAENMRRLINDLLDFSRVANSQQPFVEVNLAIVVGEVKTDLELVIEETGTNIVFNNLPVLVAVHSQIKQLFINIISNAIKFHKKGTPPIITISARTITNEEKYSLELTEEKSYYKINIEDNGIGFEPEYAQRIFYVFQRLHGRSEYPGTGIGLAICKKIVDYHRGIIYATGIPEKGSVFTIILPAEQPNAKPHVTEP